MNTAFLLSAGESRRFHGDKLFAEILGKTVISHSLVMLEKADAIEEIYIAASRKNKKKIEEMVRAGKFGKVKKIVVGGASRFDSVKNLLAALPEENKKAGNFLIIHNAANPFAEAGDIEKCLKKLEKGGRSLGGVAVGRKVSATIRRVKIERSGEGGETIETLNRGELWEMETPQVVRAGDFVLACRRAKRGVDYTDDLAVIEAAGMNTAVVETSAKNTKITTAEDLPMEFLCGVGEDAHRFASAQGLSSLRARNCRAIAHRRTMRQTAQVSRLLRDARNDTAVESAKCFVLGGVKIKNFPPMDANSDGDVIFHALCNAISSAMGGGSLGTFATKMHRRGVRDSGAYLKFVLGKLYEQNLRIVNVSVSVETQILKIDPLVPAIKAKLCELFKIPKKKIGITATTLNGVSSFRGRPSAYLQLGKADSHRNGIKCTAIVTLCHLM